MGDDVVERTGNIVFLDLALVAQGCELRVDRKRSHCGDAILLGNGGTLGLAEDMMLLAALVTLEVRHVLDQAHNGDIQVVRQVDRLADDHGNKLLRCGNGDDTINGQHLEHREEHIGGSRRHVDQHVVDVAPVGLVPELLDDAGNDRAAPCDGHIALREHEVHGHDLNAAVGERRVDARLVSMQLVGHAERLRDGGAGDVRVQDADVETLLAQLACEQARHEGLANAALAGHNADHVLHVARRVGRVLGRCRALAAALNAAAAARMRALLFFCHKASLFLVV